MNGMILAAGLGTRLKPWTDSTPKPLILLRGRPLITYTLDYMVQAQVNMIVVNTHYLAEQLPQVIGRSYGGIPITYLYEPELLGTGGGLKNACEQVLGFEDTVFLMNSDIMVDLDLVSFMKAHAEVQPDVTLLLKTVENPERFGAVGTDVDGCVKTIAKHIPYSGPALMQRMFCGTHLISSRALKKLPSEPKSFSIIDAFYVPLIQSGAKLLGVEQAGQYYDLGTHESFSEAEKYFTSPNS